VIGAYAATWQIQNKFRDRGSAYSFCFGECRFVSENCVFVSEFRVFISEERSVPEFPVSLSERVSASEFSDLLREYVVPVSECGSIFEI